MGNHLWNDLRFTIRQLAKNPGFAVTAIAVLALGMCASVAIFAFVDAALIKPLPYRDPARLVGAFETTESFAHSNLSYPDYLDWKRMNTVFQSLDIYLGRMFSLTTNGGREFVRTGQVSAGFFRTLGVAPVLGRDFHDGEDRPSQAQTVLLSYDVWQQKYGGRLDIIGQNVTLEDGAWTVIGVLPAGFHFAPLGLADYWTTLRPTSECDLRRSCHHIYGVARLKDGVSVEAAAANMAAVAKQLEREYPATNRSQGGTAVALSEVIVGDIRPVLMVLLSGAGLLLLIAAVNVAGLLQVRSEGRAREMAVRRAVGASNARLMAQYLVEAVTLVAIGGGLGIAAAHSGIELLAKMVPAGMMQRMPFLIGLGINGRVAAFAALAAFLATVLFAAAPALRHAGQEMREAMAEGGRGGAGTTWRKLGSKLVILELATAMVLLTGAGLLGKSLYQLMKVKLGLEPERLVMLDVVGGSAYAKNPQKIMLGRELAEKIRSLPGVTSVGYETNGEPFGGNGNTSWLRVLGRPWNGDHNNTAERYISPTYFQTLGAQLRKGRYFGEADDESKPPVAIVNQAFARKLFPGQEAIGQKLAYVSGSSDRLPVEIVGIVDDIREGPMDREIPPFLYRPFNQGPDSFISLVARSSRPDAAILGEMTAALRQLDPDLITLGGKAMTDRINETQSVSIHRLSAWLVGGFAGLALLVGVVGLYGVIAYSVGQRTREIGVRMALGARPGAVYLMVMREAGWLTLAGLAIGVVCSVGMARLLQGLLFGVSAWDAATIAAVAVVLGVAAAAAAFAPARRAASINPVDALRAE